MSRKLLINRQQSFHFIPLFFFAHLFKKCAGSRPHVASLISFPRFFVRDGILSVADYDSTRVGVVVVIIVVVNTFLQWDNLNALSYQVEILHDD